MAVTKDTYLGHFSARHHLKQDAVDSLSEDALRYLHEREHEVYQSQLDHGEISVEIPDVKTAEQVEEVMAGNPPRVRTLKLPKSGRMVTFTVQRGNPPKVEAERGGAIRYRTIRLPDNRYMHVAVTREPGPRGGRTVGGEVHEKGE